ncbi:MAG: hypothetical protein HYY40_01030 [Bacteroidetes bacterium]|nr:hypothetical protein [Bacteroidota bacterium]
MKAVFIVYNHAITEEILEILETLDIKGFTKWNNIQGTGTSSGEPHLGTHTWPSLNDAILTVIEESKYITFSSALRELNNSLPEQGLRTFAWDAEVIV